MFEVHRPSSFFFGRDHEMDAIIAALKNDASANIAILGPGGIGVLYRIAFVE